METSSSAAEPSPRSEARKPPMALRKRSAASSVLTSIASSPSTPLTITGFPPPTSCISASLSEWAGSVLTMRVDSPESARRTAIELDVLVLPTPPLPPTKISRCAAVLGCRSVVSPAGGGASTVHTGATALRLCCVRPPGAKWKAAPALIRVSRRPALSILARRAWRRQGYFFRIV